MLKNALFVCTLLVVASCDAMATKYAYAPKTAGEIPATINFGHTVLSDEKTFFGTVPTQTIQVALSKINGVYVPTALNSMQGGAESFQLSPGLTNLAVSVKGTAIGQGSAVTTVDLTFTAVAGQKYSLGAYTSPTGEFGVWIEDAAKNRVAASQLRLKSRYGY